MSSPLVSCEGVSKSHGSLLFKDLSLSIFKGDRIGLIGPNGSGKSTFLKLLCGLERPDTGKIIFQRNIKVGYVPQESRFSQKTIREILLEVAKAHSDHHSEPEVEVEILMGKMGFDNPDQVSDTLSGGWKKRLEIAKQLITEPDLLLLDEPTNHLDLEGVIWLEKFLERQKLTYLVISHDRYFLENVTSRIVEINPTYPKGMFGAEGSYSSFLEHRETFLSGQIEQEKSLSSKVRREIEWLKQNPKARTTKSRSRIQEAEKLQRELNDIKTRNEQTASPEIDFSSTFRETRKLLAVKNISKSLSGRKLFSGIDLILTPGLRLGIIGANGTGKSTFLKILAGQLLPDTGTIKTAEGIKIVLFDQHREKLPSDMTLRNALAPQGDWVDYRGQKIHVNGWCKRFLFSPHKLDLPVSFLSGGERARVLIARLMLQPADILLLDEPTNDLDISTLEVLEENLQEFPGAVVMITHDRYMMEETCNLLLGIMKDGFTDFVADLSQWEIIQKERENQQKNTKNVVPKETPKSSSKEKPKLTYQERKEWEEIENKIEKAEQEVNCCELELHDPIISQDLEKLSAACKKLNAAEQHLNHLYNRWQELEDKQKL